MVKLLLAVVLFAGVGTTSFAPAAAAPVEAPIATVSVTGAGGVLAQ